MGAAGGGHRALAVQEGAGRRQGEQGSVLWLLEVPVIVLVPPS